MTHSTPVAKPSTACNTLGNDSENSQLLKREFLKVHNTKYLSVKCTVLMHLSFTCVTRSELCVCLHISNIKRDGSRVTYQMGQWVMGQFQ